MARLLGLDKSELQGAALSACDGLDPGLLRGFCETVRATGEAWVSEQAFPQLARADLGTDTTLRFVCTPVGEKVQIVVQDVSQTRWLEKTFARYLSSKVIERLRQVPPADLLKVERRVVTVLFADLRGFTRVSQEIEPEQVCAMVNSYLSRMVDCVEKYDGTVDKFVGDEIMAVFGAPLFQADHALRALLCAVDMVRSHQEWQGERTGQPAPAVGVGLVTGEVIVGNIGTEKQMDYTVMGHPVNLAARLCGAAAGLEILTVAATHQAAQGFSLDNMPRLHFEVKGKLELKNVKVPIDVIRVTAG
jgi:class 3 adenylate cyclase